MDFQHTFNALFIVSTFTLLVNLPLGYARVRTKRYSLRWFLCIHVPIPFIFIARTLSNLDIKYIPIFVIVAIVGQFFGGKLEF